jgi:DHA1 family bicyclomycin/chloramphenicol resistance-like MFS transporter
MKLSIRFNRHSVLTVVIAATVVNILATTMYLPAIPAIAKDLNSDIHSVQLLLTAYLATSAAGQLFLGPLSDATGRRGLVITGAIFSTIIAFACAAANAVGILILLRFIQWMTGSAFVVATRAIVRDINDRSGTARDMAGILLAISFVAPISQTIGGLLTDLFSWRSTFAVVAGGRA